MTRVYQNPAQVAGLRAIIAGAGAYPNAKGPAARVALKDLTSVPPSVLTLAGKLLTDWRGSLSKPLVSIDLMLSDPAKPAVWPGFGAPGEIAAGAAIDPPTRANIDAAITGALAGSTKDDGLLLLFCGHGVAKDDRYFLPSDFGSGGNPWSLAINLNEFRLALQQEAPRVQWLFWDCCANIPEDILRVLGTIGSSPISRDAGLLSEARAHGPLHQFRLSSAAEGEEAFGIPDAPSRFMEMLVEALDGAGCNRRVGADWPVSHAGIQEAIQSYADRKQDLDKPAFYRFVSSASTDTQGRMLFRKLPAAPKATLVARSNPRPDLKKARLEVSRNGANVHDLAPPQRAAVVYLSLDPDQTYEVTATFEDGVSLSESVHAYLPMPDPLEFVRT
ncbi:MAG TPA: hypothetical protein VEA44_07570 [Caulobacter sp.]|nr:hypothetical protein [Caulobacter sp.]